MRLVRRDQGRNPQSNRIEIKADRMTMRAILKRSFRDTVSGIDGYTFETLDFDYLPLEQRLKAGGYGETGFEKVELVGIEHLKQMND